MIIHRGKTGLLFKQLSKMLRRQRRLLRQLFQRRMSQRIVMHVFHHIGDALFGGWGAEVAPTR